MPSFTIKRELSGATPRYWPSDARPFPAAIPATCVPWPDTSRAWDKLVSFLRRGRLQGFVDFSLRENPVKALIPKFKDPGGAVCVAEIRVGVVNAGVDDGSDDTGTVEIVLC